MDENIKKNIILGRIWQNQSHPMKLGTFSQEIITNNNS